MKKFKFRMQVVLEMREKELEERQMEMAKILAALSSQEEKLKQIHAIFDLCAFIFLIKKLLLLLSYEILL